jgi:hypothetical protein
MLSEKMEGFFEEPDIEEFEQNKKRREREVQELLSLQNEKKQKLFDPPPEPPQQFDWIGGTKAHQIKDTGLFLQGNYDPDAPDPYFFPERDERRLRPGMNTYRQARLNWKDMRTAAVNAHLRGESTYSAAMQRRREKGYGISIPHDADKLVYTDKTLNWFNK